MPTLADHKAIQKWVCREFQWQLYYAFVGFDWPGRPSEEIVRLHCNAELVRQTEEREHNLQRAEYTIEGYERFRFSMLFMKKHSKLQGDALACICIFLLGHAIANLHVAGN